MRQRLEGRTHMRRGIRIAVAGVPLVGREADDPSPRCRRTAERELPILILQRHHALFELNAFDFHDDLISAINLSHRNSFCRIWSVLSSCSFSTCGLT